MILHLFFLHEQVPCFSNEAKTGNVPRISFTAKVLWFSLPVTTIQLKSWKVEVLQGQEV
jgi:hypothetical protein